MGKTSIAQSHISSSEALQTIKNRSAGLAPVYTIEKFGAKGNQKY